MATITADSNSQADVQTAVTAANTGDTVIVPTTPSASATWATCVTISKAITVSGTGVTLNASGALANGFFWLKDLASDEILRIAGFIFNGSEASASMTIYTSGLTLTKLRIDHNTFNKGYQILHLSGCKGVVDNNYFYNCHYCWEFTAGTREQADASWVSMEAGTSDALFVEDNNIIFDADWTAGTGNYAIMDTYNGGKIVVRYNTINSTNIPAGFTDQMWLFTTHGSAGGGASPAYWQANIAARRGQSVVEIYNNTITGKKFAKLCILRGSANLVHDNVCNSETFGTGCYMYEEEQYETQWDPLRTAWPAEDQVHNTFFWNNIFNEVAQAADNFEVATGSSDYIQLNRDYFIHRPATIGEGLTLGIETFTGSNGASGTHPTDGDPYATEGTMIFTADVENAYYGYVPYTYPHPLQGQTTPWVMIYG